MNKEPETKILIIEDEGVVAEDLKECLLNLGYTVCGTVNSGLDAFKIVEAAEPDLALVDINIKGNLDGTEVGAILRTKYAIPFIYVTAYAGDKTLERVRPTQPSGYIVKPYNERELHMVIELALQNEKRRQKLESWGEWLALTLASIGEAVIATDVDQRVVFMNRCAEILTGWKYEEACGLTLQEVLKIKFKQEDGSTLTEVQDLYPEHLTLARVRNALLQDKKFQHTPIDYTVTPIASGDGSCSGVVIVARDAPASTALNEY